MPTQLVNQRTSAIEEGKPHDQEYEENGNVKKFTCDAPYCTRSFLRRDHLDRHKLNHTSQRLKCDRCDSQFSRKDLLKRHLRRHDEKDALAGGKGKGYLLTRKRVWNPNTGYTSKKKIQSFKKATTNLTDTADKTTKNNTDIDDTIRPDDQQPDTTPTIDFPNIPSSMISNNSTPKSRCSTTSPSNDSTSSSSNIFAPSSSDHEDINDKDHNNAFDNQNGLNDEFRSFKLPFSTFDNYSWIFEEFGTEQMNQSLNSGFFGGRNSPSTPPLAVTPLNFSKINYASRSIVNLGSPTSASYNSDFSLTPKSSRYSSFCYSNANNSRFSTDNGKNFESNIDNNHLHARYRLRQNWIDPSENYNFDSDYYAEPLIPNLTMDDRDRIANFIIQSTSAFKSDQKDTQLNLFTNDSPFLQLSNLQECVSKYFTKFNVTYPLLHHASFKPETTDPLLLTSIIIMGSSYSSSKSIHKNGVKIHDCLRGVLISSSHFSTKPDLWVLQALLLIEAFGKNRAGLEQYEMSILFNGLLINLIRRSCCQNIRTELYKASDESSPLKSWRSWIHAESMKRVVLLAFLWDVQHSVLYNQVMALSAFELSLDLPSDLDVWNARDEIEWLAFKKTENPPRPFLTTLKMFLNCVEKLPYINSLSRVLMLHGLMAISWDMQRRDQASLDFQIDPIKWKFKLNKAFDHWKRDFDKFSRRIMVKINTNTEQVSITNRNFFVKYLTTNNAMYHYAVLSLWTNIVDLQIFAGAKHIMGVRVSDYTYQLSKKQLVEWVYQIGISDKAVLNAAQILRCGLTNLDNWEVDGTFHYPWCLYISVLTCWAFFKILDDQSIRLDKCSILNTDNSGANIDSSEDHRDSTIKNSSTPTCNVTDPSFVTDHKSSIRRVVAVITSGTPDEIRTMKNIELNDLKGMVLDMANHLSTVRWALIYEAFKVLQEITTNS